MYLTFATKRMGIVKYTGIFIANLVDQIERALREVNAVFIDGNQFVYSVVDLLKKNTIGILTNTYMWRGTAEEFDTLLYQLIKEVILTELINPLKKFHNLKHITFCLDGIPCNGKLVNQFIRRKTPTYFVNPEDKVLLSDAIIIANSPFIRTFGKVAVEEFVKAFRPSISLLFNLDDILGEGEHKMLDVWRSSAFVDSPVLVWSSDSDVPVCLLSTNTEQVFVRTVIHKFDCKEDKVYRISDLRNSMCSNYRERNNSQLLIAFFGNDFLPQMINTINLEKTYATLRKTATNVSLTDQVGQFSPSGFLTFLKEFDEIDFIFAKDTLPKRTTESQLVQFSEYGITKPQDISSLRDFKSFYYTNFGLLEHRFHPDIPISSDSIIDIEMEAALSYLETYIWYHSYSNGFDLEGRFETFYKFNLPPLFDSLIKMLAFPTLKVPSGRCLNDILSLKRVRREDRPSKSPSINIQALSILQKREIEYLFPPEVMAVAMAVRSSIERFYLEDPPKTSFIKTRLFGKEPIVGTTLFKLANMGTKVYHKFDFADLMRRIELSIEESFEIEYDLSGGSRVFGQIEKIERRVQSNYGISEPAED
jgi:hypothetical protein